VEGPAVRARIQNPSHWHADRDTTARPAQLAQVTVATPTAAPEPLHLQANQQATPRSAFTELITTRRLSLWFLITAAFIAFGLGALHALEPGHGKTIVAAYL